jgi:alanine racemase
VTGGRPAEAVVDLSAIRHNVRLLLERAAPAGLCAVVKADAYGHGAVEVARAALDAGATWLGVALTAEGAELRAAGVDAPVLVLSEPAPAEWDDVVRLRLVPAVYSEAGIDGLAKAVAGAGADPLPVHLKVDTGMHRVGAPLEAAVDRARLVGSHPELVLGAVWTHCAVADEPDDPFTAVQADRFAAVLRDLAAAGIGVPMAHAANSAATIAWPALRHDMVRCGIAVYGIDPSPALAGRLPLRPALSLRARVTHVQRLPAGERVSYGRRRPLPVESVVATVPLGYADGVSRRLGEVGGEVLVGGRRRPFAGTVTMDQVLVDCGPAGDADVAVGDEVVLVGEQGGERITAQEWADRLGTIAYEIVCAMALRVPRRYVA